MRHSSRRVTIAQLITATTFLSALPVSLVHAQVDVGARQMRASGEDSTVRSPFTIDSTHLFSATPSYRARPTRKWVIAFAGTALLAAPFDKQIESALQSGRMQRSNALRSTVGTFNVIGGTGVLAANIGALVLGRAFGDQGIATAGLQGTEAIIVSGTVVQGLKTLAGRQRPYLDTHDAGDFFLGRGMGGGKTSFPSGHTAAAFSAATVLASRLGDRWPGARWFTTPLLLGGATMVGFSRMYDSKHWMSDVVVGAGIGTVSALRVLRWNDAHPDNRLARVLGGVSLMPAMGRMAITWSPN